MGVVERVATAHAPRITTRDEFIGERLYMLPVATPSDTVVGDVATTAAALAGEAVAAFAARYPTDATQAGRSVSMLGAEISRVNVLAVKHPTSANAADASGLADARLAPVVRRPWRGRAAREVRASSDTNTAALRDAAGAMARGRIDTPTPHSGSDMSAAVLAQQLVDYAKSLE